MERDSLYLLIGFHLLMWQEACRWRHEIQEGLRPPILEAIRELWQQHPDWTLGQLIEKVVATQGARGGIRAMDDDAMLMGIIELLHSRSKRSAGTP